MLYGYCRLLMVSAAASGMPSGCHGDGRVRNGSRVAATRSRKMADVRPARPDLRHAEGHLPEPQRGQSDGGVNEPREKDGDLRGRHFIRHFSLRKLHIKGDVKYVRVRAGSNGIDIEVSRRHPVSVSNFQNIAVSTDDRDGSFLTFFLDTGANSSIDFSTRRLE